MSDFIIAQAAENFVAAWADLLNGSLVDDYGCHLNCGEAEAAADLMRMLGHDVAADSLIRAHAEHDDEGDAHYAERKRRA